MKSFRILPCVAFLALGACSSIVASNDGSPTSDASDVATGADVVDVPVSIDTLVPVDVAPDRTVAVDVATVDVARDRVIPDVSYPADAGVSCGSTNCTTGQVCCGMASGGTIALTCMDSCPDASITISCSGPEMCGGNPCCASIAIGSGGGTPLGGVSCTTSPDACIPNFDFATRSGETRLCHTDSDCAPSTALPSCCTLSRGGVSEHVCFNAGFVGFLPGSSCP